jgi:hypothetical protein
MDEKTTSIKLTGLIALILIISAFLYFQFVVPYHLYFKEQIQLFVYSVSYFSSYFTKPGGWACLSGDFLTQFLYLKGGGAVTVSIVLLVEWLLIVKSLQLCGIKQWAPFWGLFPVIAEWIVFSGISFSIALSMAFIFTLVAFWIYTLISNEIASFISGILFVPILYFLVGGSMLLFPILVLVYEIFTGKKRFVYWLIIVLLAGFLPYFLRHHFLLSLHQAYFYPFLNYKNELSTIVLSIFIFFSCFKTLRNLVLTAYSFYITIALLFVLGIGGLIQSTNLKMEKILGMATESAINYYDLEPIPEVAPEVTFEAYLENWEKVLKMAKKRKLSNNIATYYTYYTNIALLKQMQMSGRMMEFYQPLSGLFLPVDPQSDWLSLFFSSDVYFLVGDMNMAQHSAMLGTIFSPYQRSSRLTQRLIEINLVNNDIPAAMKYIRLLESTWVHKKQAALLKKMLTAENEADYPWLQNQRQKIHKSDILRSFYNPRTSLELLVRDNPHYPVALFYLLSYQLLNKDISGFFETYSHYYKGNINYIPQMYAEALLFYAATTNTKLKETDYPIDPDYIKNFKEYTELYESTQGDQKTLQEKFSDTYWLYYHFESITP